MKDTDLAWLAGIWEGEGSILLYSREHKNNRLQITPSVCMSNSDVNIVNKCRKIIEDMGCHFSYREYKPKGKSSYLLQHKITSNNASYIKIFLEHLTPYLIGNKRSYAEMLYAFVTRRAEKALTQKGGLKHLPYDEEDYNYIRSSTTTRETSTEEDIV